MSSNTFLSPEELEVLTGRKSKKHQISALRMMRVPFWVNAIGCPVVSRSAIDATPSTPSAPNSWSPALR